MCLNNIIEILALKLRSQIINQFYFIEASNARSHKNNVTTSVYSNSAPTM